MNLVSLSALGESIGTCADIARHMTQAFEERGASAFLTPADSTQNAILWCLFDDRPLLLRHTPPAAYFTTRAALRCAGAGVQFDVASDLSRTLAVTAEDVAPRLADFAAAF